MPIPKPDRKIVYIDDTAPANSEYVAWIDTTTRTIKVFEGGQWVVKALFAEEGYTGEIKNGNETMVFENGVLKKYG